MLIHALITSIGAGPEPAILLVLDGLNKVLANLLGCRTGISVLAENNLAQLLLVPVVDGIRLLRLLLRSLNIPGIGVEVLLGGFPLDVRIVTELALPALLAMALLIVDAENRLGIHAKGNLLDLHGLEQLCRFLGGLFCSLLLARLTGLLSLLSLGVWRLAGGCLALELGDLLLCLRSFFLYEIPLVIRGREPSEFIPDIRFSCQRSTGEKNCQPCFENPEYAQQSTQTLSSTVAFFFLG